MMRVCCPAESVKILDGLFPLVLPPQETKRCSNPPVVVTCQAIVSPVGSASKLTNSELAFCDGALIFIATMYSPASGAVKEYAAFPPLKTGAVDVFCCG